MRHHYLYSIKKYRPSPARAVSSIKPIEWFSKRIETRYFVYGVVIMKAESIMARNVTMAP